MTDLAWFDVDSTTAAVLHLLRLRSNDLDAPRIRSKVLVAASLIENYLDRTEPITADADQAVARTALEQVTIALTRRPDDRTPEALVDMITSTTDPLADVIASIIGLKQGWGLA